MTYVVMYFVTFERLSWEPAARPMNAQRAGEMSVGIWKIDTRTGLPSSPSTGALRRRRLSAIFWTFAAFFSRRLASEMSSETVSRTARRRAVIDFASVSRRTSSTGATASVVATDAVVAAATTGAATTAAEAEAFAAFFTGAAATGAAATTGAATAEAEALPFVAAATEVVGATEAIVSVFVATFFVDLAAELIIPDTEEVTEDILRRTYWLSMTLKSLFVRLFTPGPIKSEVRLFLF